MKQSDSPQYSIRKEIFSYFAHVFSNNYPGFRKYLNLILELLKINHQLSGYLKNSVILGWPKSSFGFFHRVQKPERTFWSTQYLKDKPITGITYSCRMISVK